MSKKSYRDAKALNFSTLKLVDGVETQAGFKWVCERSSGDHMTPAQKLGTAIHAMLLEPEKNLVYTLPEGTNLRTKAGKEALKVIPQGGIVLSSEDHDLAATCASNAISNPAIWELLKGARTEVEVYADLNGRPVKGMIDAIGNNYLIDVKTTRHNFSSFKYEIFKQNYHAQLAWYLKLAQLDGLITDQNTQLYIIAICSTTTETKLIRLEESAIHAGWAQCEIWLQKMDNLPKHTENDTASLF